MDVDTFLDMGAGEGGGRLRRAWNSRGMLYVAAAFIATVALVGLVIGVTGGSDGSDSAASSAQAQVAGPEPTDHDLSIPKVAPKVTWDAVPGGAGLTVPNGGTLYGPTVRDEDRQVFTHYAHTPRGALVFLADVTVRDFVGSQWANTAHAQLVGEGVDAYLRIRGGQDNAPPAGGYCQLAGFKDVAWTADKAAVTFANVCPSGAITQSRLTAVWQDNDWRQYINVGGSESPPMGGLLSLEGFVPFADNHMAAFGEGPAT